MIKRKVILCSFVFFAMRVQAQSASIQLKPDEIFKPNKTIMFKDYFEKDFAQWVLSIDALYDKTQRPVSTDRIRIVPVNSNSVSKGVRFEVTGAPETFRSELALPAEKGWQERWYAEKIYLEKLPTDEQGYIVMQWHAQMGNNRVDRDFPNLAIKVSTDHWQINQAYGDPANIQRTITNVPKILTAQTWEKILVHVKWSADENGIIQIWINDEMVLDKKGPNLYIGLQERSPYFKTGIYRPSHKHSKDPESSTVVLASQIKIGNEKANYEIMNKE